jgi:large subunit ribosomal protein L17
LFQHLAEGLFRSYQIITTVEKAKEARSYVERLITLAKKGEDPQAQRRVLMELEDKTAYMTLFQKIGPLYQKEDRKGGYTRIVRLGHRPGDGAEMAVLELVDREKLGAAPGKPPKTKKEAKEKAGAAGR